MACNLGIFADILNDCAYSPVAGAEVDVYLFNRADISTVTYNATNSHTVEAITLASGKYAYKHTGFKKSINAGHELVAGDNVPDTFKQSLDLVAWGIDSATVKALDNLSDVVAIVENKNKGVAGDGAFMVLGLETGLHKSADTRKVNDNLGTRAVSLATLDGEAATVSNHVFFKTDYSTTLGLIEGLLAP